jgi:hypothetical protein
VRKVCAQSLHINSQCRDFPQKNIAKSYGYAIFREGFVALLGIANAQWRMSLRGCRPDGTFLAQSKAPSLFDGALTLSECAQKADGIQQVFRNPSCRLATPVVNAGGCIGGCRIPFRIPIA